MIKYTDSTQTTTTAVCVTGSKGSTGATGAQGPQGDKGQTGATGNGVSSVDVQYYKSTSSTSLTGGSWSTTNPGWENGKYIWSKTVITYTNGQKEETTPVCITGAKGSTGAQGPKGDTGATGPKGDKGDTGATGKGISSITEKYAVSSSNSTAPTSWSNSVQTMTATNKYLWNYEIIKYTDNSTVETAKRVIGVYGDKGATGATGSTGKGISSITNYYLVSASSSGVTTSTSGWFTTPGATSTSKKYLWNYEKITYTDNSTTKTTPHIIGTHGATGATGPKGDKGDTGDTGKGVSKTEVYYYLSTSNTTQSGGSWVTTPPTWSNGKYYWQKIKTTFTDGSTSESTPVCITGAKGSTGSTGATGKGISSITTEFYLSTSKTEQVNGSWTTTPPTWSNGKYVWTRIKIVYTNPSSTVYTTPVCDSSWEAVNEIEVGGRNYWQNGDLSSDLPAGTTKRFGGEVIGIEEGNVTGFDSCFHVVTSGRILSSYFNRDTEELVGKTLTMQCWIKYSDVTAGTNS